MRKEDLEFLRSHLAEELAALQDKADATVLELLRTSSEGEPDPLDRATQDDARASVYRIRSRESRLIKKIKASLRAIEEGRYGICEDCEEDISIERMKARPVTSYCIACKSRRETYERVVGT